MSMSIPHHDQAQVARPVGCRHASAAEWGAFVGAYTATPDYQRLLRQNYERFVRQYPDLHDWCGAPLAERVGRLYGEEPNHPSYRVSYRARTYLAFLALRGYARFDWDWILAIGRVRFREFLRQAHADLGIDTLVAEASALDYAATNMRDSLHWAVARLCLRHNVAHVDAITDAHLRDFDDALQRFAARPDLALYYGPQSRVDNMYHNGFGDLYRLKLVLYHRGQTSVTPRRKRSDAAPPFSTAKPRMDAVVERYFRARAEIDCADTARKARYALHMLVDWLTQTYPAIETFAALTRDHVLEFLAHLHDRKTRRGTPLAVDTRWHIAADLSTFFRDVAAWEWADCPQRPVLLSRDMPRRALRVPRFIPDDELERLMAAIRALDCPYQRAALLVARWSGARRDEIRRLSLDCLDRYPNGTPRLRLPAGKTRQERLVPLTEEAAEAIRTVQALHRGEQRGLPDRLTNHETHYLFVRRGTLLSMHALFEVPLALACRQAGLLTPDGRPTVTAHRFRHTIATHLARKGARLHTIMKVLGHSSVDHAVVYAHIADREVLDDYLSALGPGAPVAGPAAETVRAGHFTPAELDWLTCNYLKNELELGHCLRLPEEGPCECDLYLTCPKFFTTRAKAPRWRLRRRIEVTLAADALAHGWEAEATRHQRLALRCEEYLAALDEPIAGPEARE